MIKFMFDTNIFNRIFDGKINIKSFSSKNKYYVTHIQLDELNATTDAKRKRELLKVFKKVVSNKVPTESTVWDISNWDDSKWSSEKTLTPTEAFVLGVSRLGKAKLGKADIYTLIKNEVDKRKKKSSNIQDALIAETSIKNKFTLVTDDRNLGEIVKKIGGMVINFQDFKKR